MASKSSSTKTFAKKRGQTKPNEKNSTWTELKKSANEKTFEAIQEALKKEFETREMEVK